MEARSARAIEDTETQLCAVANTVQAALKQQRQAQVALADREEELRVETQEAHARAEDLGAQLRAAQETVRQWEEERGSTAAAAAGEEGDNGAL